MFHKGKLPPDTSLSQGWDWGIVAATVKAEFDKNFQKHLSWMIQVFYNTQHSKIVALNSSYQFSFVDGTMFLFCHFTCHYSKPPNKLSQHVQISMQKHNM
jgi:hypothetical protein